MRTPIRHPFGLVVPRSAAALLRAIAVVGVLAVVATAHVQAAEPEPEPKATASAPAAPGWPATVVGTDGYEEYVVDDLLRKEHQSDVNRMRRGDAIPNDERAVFEQYYRKYALARWTQADQLSELRNHRNRLCTEIRMIKSATVHDELVALAFDFLRQMAANPKFHPAARCTAMLCIGDLNSQEGTSSVLPVPLPQTRPVLLGALTDANQHDAVRFAALLGLYRHARILATDEPFRGDQLRNEQLIPALLTLAQAKTSPGRSPEGQGWLRARAIDTLGALKDLGPQTAAVVAALVAIINDHDDDLLVRCAAARALGEFTYPASHGLDAWQLTSALGQLASDACLEEFKQLDLDAEREKRKQKGTRGMGGMGGMMDMGSGSMDMGSGYGEMPGYDGGGGSGMPDEGMYGGSGMYGGRPREEEKEDETQGNRRRLKARLDAVVFALTGLTVRDRATLGEDLPSTGVAGLAAGPPDTDNDLVLGVLASVRALSAGCDTPREDDDVLDRETFRTNIDNLLAALTDALAKGAPPEAEEPEETEPPADAAMPAVKAPADPTAKAPATPAVKAATKPAAKAPATPAVKAATKPAVKPPAKPAAKAPAGNP